MRKILITGASGFIGRNLLTVLNGANEIILLGRTENKIYKSIRCDFTNDKVPSSCLEDIDIVFHLAGLAHTDLDHKEAKYQHHKINYEATVDLAKKAAQKKVKQFVFLSSVKANTAFQSSIRISEDDKSYPEGEYGISKKKAEDEILEIANKTDMQVKIVRSSLVYGPGVKGNLEIMKNLINKGWFPPIPEFNNRRSMIHVYDLARALLFVADRDEANKNIYIVTDGNDYSSTEIYERILANFGRTAPRFRIPKQLFYLITHINMSISGKIRKIVADEFYSSKKIESLGFNTKHSFRDFDEEII